MSDRVCGCNVVTAAGIATSLQMVILVLALSSTGLILDRYRLWKEVGSGTPMTTVAPANASIQSVATIWSEAWLELAMAWYVAFACFWLFTLFIVCLSFKYYRPVFVVPNFIALVVGIFMNAFGFAVILGRLLDVDKSYRTNQYFEAMLIYIMAFLLFVFIINFIFLFCMNHYHKYLGLRYGTQIPKFIQTRQLPPPNTAHTAYNNDYGHATNNDYNRDYNEGY
ncbi:hypothetical protein FO519_000569 [Halicephalobus sp. NKZ332]|nr:hypothetical protein FO519_000569 [Halicephalobus sp. NKZ332]